MADITGSPAVAGKTTLYANYFVDQHLAIADVNTAIAELMLGWQKPFWPSPESIGSKAREIGVRTAFQESSRGQEVAELERHSIVERERLWAERTAEADGWCEGHLDQCREVALQVEAEITRIIARGSRRMADNTAYRNAWRDGAMVGAVLRRIGEEQIKEERRKHAVQETV